MRPQPLICCKDVEKSSLWYQRLLGLKSAHGGPHYERLNAADGTLVMQLHCFEQEDHHGRIGDETKPLGNGVVLWFEVDDFDAVEARAKEMKATFQMAKVRNPPDGKGGPNHWEIWLRDLDGYSVVVCSPDGSAG